MQDSHIKETTSVLFQVELLGKVREQIYLCDQIIKSVRYYVLGFFLLLLISLLSKLNQDTCFDKELTRLMQVLHIHFIDLKIYFSKKQIDS